MSTGTYLITGAAGGVGSVSTRVVRQLLGRGEKVRALVHRQDSRADALRESGAEVIVGDLTNPVDVGSAMFGISRMFFNMSVSAEYLEAAALVCLAAKELDGLEVLVNMSQMTVSQMSTTSVEESRQQRLHWLAEHVVDWSGIPAVHVRPTVFMDNPLFTVLAARSIRQDGRLALPFGAGRTSPIDAGDVADVVTAVLTAPTDHLGAVYELTGPAALDIDGLAEQYASALNRPVTGVRLPYDQWLDDLSRAALDPHTQDHIATMARLHRDGRYDRMTHTVEDITGHSPKTVEQYIARNRDLFE
ncbi:NAD(P)H-binding protein [Nocardia jiangxiensis]|uniref:NAD(P)H-binding protein n=1 Tax=Nocardia jiangxiensis TaxID=282685 RepID=UPI0002D6B88C|nr:NAD(P)H-binding protein [Nocardia jiangxiensis]